MHFIERCIVQRACLVQTKPWVQRPTFKKKKKQKEKETDTSNFRSYIGRNTLPIN